MSILKSLVTKYPFGSRERNHRTSGSVEEGALSIGSRSSEATESSLSLLLAVIVQTLLFGKFPKLEAELGRQNLNQNARHDTHSLVQK